ncbi:FtsX-like permease family protein [Stenotrophomonas sp. MMGLT7]|uniref:ABC transporter permease n=1 Tax=Stenotrophomonas sp. MMGLT7 TaxID=2901227 RepID=UPI001E5F06A4|nr:FtsX-like permease family protein [Stenotrophomonas sp. MMGLT7]MCD7099223.1 ABC transporter permease [Stenotrophomonas sp. MMGLT7]
MEIRPILSTLNRHRIAAALIVLEIALSCAIICNALSLVGQRWNALHQPSGIDEDRLLRINLGGVGKDTNADARTREDLAILRGLPGVEAATIVQQMPLSQNGEFNTSLGLLPDQDAPTLSTSLYLACADLLPTLGLAVVAGRNLEASDCLDYSAIESGSIDFSKLRAPVLINQETARRLFPDGNALGSKLYTGDLPLTVVGIVSTLARANAGNDGAYAMVLPARMNYGNGGSYVVRVKDPARRDEVMAAATDALLKNDASRILLEHDSYQAMRRDYFSGDRDMIGLLLVVCALLLAVTALGIVGLASFWVQQRTKQIGIRRALGATRGQILRYFQTENFLLATIGIVLGMLLAYALNQLLMSRYELPRLPLWYLPVGALLLWALGQLSVLAPARKAAAVPPAVATRSA